MDLAISNWMFDTFGSSKAFAIVSRIITELGCKWAIMTAVAVLLIFKKTRKLGVYAMFACGLAFCINNIILKNVIEILFSESCTDYSLILWENYLNKTNIIYKTPNKIFGSKLQKTGWLQTFS